MKASKLPSGKWRARASYTQDGVHHTKSFTADTQKEAEYKALAFKLGKERISDKSNITVCDAVGDYIDSNINVLSPSTIRSYRTIQRSQMQSISSIPLGRLNNENLQRWISELTRKYSPKTVHNCWHLFTAMMSTYAPGTKFNVNLPQKRKTDIVIPDDAQVNELIENAIGTPLYLPILLAAHCGLRRSEICSLTWKDIDLKNRVIHIRGAIVRGEDGWEKKTTKSYAGNRDADMTNKVYDYLSTISKKDKIVTLTPAKVTERFRTLCDKLGYDFHFHLLRHYYCSVLILNNLPMFYIVKKMGHSSDDMVKKVYAHIMGDADKEFKKSVMDYFNS